MTPDLFLAAGAALARKAMAHGVAEDQGEAIIARAVSQGAAARGHPQSAT
jgi:hypothetical protein